MRNLFMAVFCMLSASQAVAQNYTLSGTIRDSATLENLIGVYIYTEDGKIGTVTNDYGFYSVTLPMGTYNVVYSYVGYREQRKQIKLDKSVVININLAESNYLDEFTKSAVKSERIEESTQMGTIKISQKQLLQLPAFLGEVDVLKTIQLLPGVNPGVEGSSGLYVRGGSPDQNLILLDNIPLYNVSHLFGFFSVFNADAIQNVELIKGGFPARYGGRLSSVLEINMREGDKKKYHVQGNLGLISAKLTAEGPIQKEKSSFLFTARRTYMDALVNPILRASNAIGPNMKQGYYFYDLNGKMNFNLTDKDRLYVSGYMGNDLFYNTATPYEFIYDGVIYENESKDQLGWGNKLLTARWTHQFSNKLFSNLQAAYTQYNYDVLNYRRENVQADTGVQENIYRQQFVSGINDIVLKSDFTYVPDSRHYIRFGGAAIYHTFKPGATAYELKNTQAVDDNVDTTLGATDINALEVNAYVEDDFALSKRFKLNYGLHLSLFSVQGKNYMSAQPRLSARYLMSSSWALKASYAMMQQNVHLLTNNSIGLPTDLWVPSSSTIVPEISHQVSAGVAKTIKDLFEFSVEGYYKLMNNIIDYKNGSTFLNDDTDWQDKVEAGTGWSYGAEFFLQKKYGQTQGWVSYTLSWTNRQFPSINFGEKFPFKYDNRHQASIAITHDFDNKKWRAGVVWVYTSGNAVTLANIRYPSANTNGGFFYNEIETFSERNGYRAADYHRLDVSLQRTWFLKKGGEVGGNFSVYNAYSRRNPFYYRFDTDFYGNRVLKRIALFPIVPTLTVNFKF